MVAVACNNMREGLECLPHTPNVIQNATGHDCIALGLYFSDLGSWSRGGGFCCNVEYQKKFVTNVRACFYYFHNTQAPLSLCIRVLSPRISQDPDIVLQTLSERLRGGTLTIPSPGGGGWGRRFRDLGEILEI